MKEGTLILSTRMENAESLYKDRNIESFYEGRKRQVNPLENVKSLYYQSKPFLQS